MTGKVLTHPDDVRLLAQTEVSIEAVGPDEAAKWLGHNASNRNLRDDVIQAYARDMKAGNWRITGEGIKFGADGKLLDGQHRLEAVKRSGATVQLLVVRGIDPAAQTVMDSGAKRTASDALRMLGRQHTVSLAAGARVALNLASGQTDTVKGGKVTHSEIAQFVADNPVFLSAVMFVAPMHHLIAAPRGVTAYVAWRLFQIDTFAANEFMTSVATQEMLRSTDPRMVLAKRLSSMRESRITESVPAYLSLFFRAWNHWRAGEQLQYLKLFRPINVPTPK